MIIRKQILNQSKSIPSGSLGRFQISLHKIMHVDSFRFCALRNKMDDATREILAGSAKGRELAKHLEALDCLASEDDVQTVLASQLEIHFSKYYFVGLIVDIV